MMKYLSTLKSLIITTIICALGFCSTQAKAQYKYNIIAGYNIIEGINTGVRYEFNQMQVGLTVGTGLHISSFSSKSFSIASDWYYHIHGVSKFSDRRTMYGKAGFSYLRESEDKYENGLYFNLRFGKDVNLSKQVGIDLEIGLSTGKYYPILPTLGMYLFFRV